MESDNPFEDDELEEFQFGRIGEVDKPKGSKFKCYLLLMLVLVMLGGVAWWYLIGVNQMADEAALPVIRAKVGPIKVKPENPGGMEIPNQDKLVYERLGSRAGEPVIERLLPEPEKPMAMPAPEAKPEPAPTPEIKLESAPTAAAEPRVNPATPPKLVVQEPPKPMEMAAEKVENVKPEPRQAAPIKLEPKTVEVTKAPEPEVVKTAPVAPKTERPMVVVAQGRYMVQMASVRSEEAAASEWKRLSKRNPDLLGKLSMSLQKADLGAKGVFYRLRAGALPDEASAKKLCAALSAKKIGCLVVRP